MGSLGSRDGLDEFGSACLVEENTRLCGIFLVGCGPSNCIPFIRVGLTFISFLALRSLSFILDVLATVGP